MVPTILFRTDASMQIGLGHAMRCFALAQAARDYGMEVIFIMKESVDSINNRIESEGCQLICINDEKEFYSLKGDYVVVDGYQFDASTQENLKKRGKRVLFIDDYGHCDQYVSDLILNQNIHADESFYRNRQTGTQLLLGLKYVLLRREFIRDQSVTLKERHNNILITMGGCDPYNLTERVEHALKHLDAEIRSAKGATNMSELMQWADIAVSAAGTTVYELAYMGVPTAMIVCAENQRRVAEEMEHAGYGVNLGWHKDVSKEHIRTTVVSLLKNDITPSRSIDPYGSHRVLSHLLEWPLWLRPAAGSGDCETLFDWANDPQTRRLSFEEGPIPWTRHIQWFSERMADPQCHFFMALDRENKPIGVIRFEEDGSDATLSFSIAPDRRGKGYGTRMVSNGIRRIFAYSPKLTIHAYVKPENDASINIFKKCGFREEKPLRTTGAAALHFMLKKGMLPA